MNTLIDMELKVNGEARRMKVRPLWTLSYVLRRVLRITGPKIGCGTGSCGACTVLLDGKAVPSCQILGLQAQGKEVVTIEGLQNDPDTQLLKENFAKYGAFQCGFCTPGVIVSAKELLTDMRNSQRQITEEDILDVLSGHICRCTGYISQINAIRSTCESIGRVREE